MRDYTVKTLDKALKLIECFACAKKELGITEISLMTGENKATVYALLNTFKARGYIMQNPENSKYRLGAKFMELGFMVHENLEVVRITRPYLTKLVEKFYETAYLVSWDGNEAVLIDKVEGINSLRMTDPIGKRYGLHCTAVGKIFLSTYSHSDIRNKLLKGELANYTTNTVTNVDLLIEELGDIKEKGYSINNEEEEAGVCCLAAPIKNHIGDTVFAISVSGSAARLMNDDLLNGISPVLIEYSGEISKQMGFKE